MHDSDHATFLRVLAGLLVLMASQIAAHAQVRSAPVPRLWCRGVLNFTDAASRTVAVFLDLERGQVSTPACRKYPDLTGYCTGMLLDVGDHSFRFGGAASPQNTKFWADLYRWSTFLPATPAGPATETMRVLFVGRCEPLRSRRGIDPK